MTILKIYYITPIEILIQYDAFDNKLNSHTDVQSLSSKTQIGSQIILDFKS